MAVPGQGLHGINFETWTQGNKQELYVNELRQNGQMSCKQPEIFFWSLTGSWRQGWELGRYWRRCFVIPYEEFQPGPDIVCLARLLQDIRDADTQGDTNMSSMATRHDQLTPGQLGELSARLAIVANMLAMGSHHRDPNDNLPSNQSDDGL